MISVQGVFLFVSDTDIFAQKYVSQAEQGQMRG
jgi:hypothetical protein